MLCPCQESLGQCLLTSCFSGPHASSARQKQNQSIPVLSMYLRGWQHYNVDQESSGTEGQTENVYPDTDPKGTPFVLSCSSPPPAPLNAVALGGAITNSGF